ncbi:MAG: hypothetical protein JSS11_09380 [Verrucomicrobia bacterium]|nr:hypothetical protein [Verrucomicrobiota bacterium]
MNLRLILKRTGLVLLGIAVGVAGGRYGPAAVSYLLIPPEHGVFRYYQTYSSSVRPYWEYWSVEDGCLVSQDFRRNDFRETWEIVHGDSSRFYLYDNRNEHDGEVIFTRTEMIVRQLSGREYHYPRVLDLWEIWREKYGFYAGIDGLGPVHYERLAPERAAYDATIARRMKQQGLTVSPAVNARRRPPLPSAAYVEPPSHAKPVFAVMEWGAWNQTGTVFALYADGTAIARTLSEMGKRREDTQLSYHWVDPADASRLSDAISAPDLTNLSEHYRLSYATDQVTTTLWISGKQIEIYGPWREPAPPPEDEEEVSEAWKRREEEERKIRATLPDALRQILLKIDRMRQAAGREWLPAKIEVSFNDYEHSRDKPILWPREWPGLYDATSRKNGFGHYSVFVPSSEWPKLRAFLATRPERGAVMIDLNLMAPTVRFPFPGESAWLK